MKFLALEKEQPGLTQEDFLPYLRDEAAHVWELYCNGVLRETYFREDLHTAVLIMECKTTMEARQVLASLPLVQAGLISFEIIPLLPYDGFARLFST
ncbi:MAG: superoxide dismutase [Anaerolineaceae bacterium]|nr:superoxide dismutase [Anaerolineaceae bacterium]